MSLTDKLDKPYPQESLEKYAGLYQKISEHKREQLSSQFGGHQPKEFYQGMMRYMSSVALPLEDLSHTDLAESALSLSLAIAHGLLHENYGARVKTISRSLFDNKMSEGDLRKAAQTPIPPLFEKVVKSMYDEAQPLQFYEGMFRAAVVVFSTAYKREKVGLEVLNHLMWNYAFLGKIISKKRNLS